MPIILELLSFGETPSGNFRRQPAVDARSGPIERVDGRCIVDFVTTVIVLVRDHAPRCISHLLLHQSYVPRRTQSTVLPPIPIGLMTPRLIRRTFIMPPPHITRRMHAATVAETVVATIAALVAARGIIIIIIIIILCTYIAHQTKTVVSNALNAYSSRTGMFLRRV